MKRALIAAITIAVICALTLTSTVVARPPEQAKGLLMDPLKIDTGYIAGTTVGDPDDPVRIYRGIPYAAPPVGDLRWQPPQPADSWAGIRECTVFSTTAVQCKEPWGLPQGHPLPWSEDCLYLNVSTPAKTHSAKLPVMVWLHGGGLITGNANSALCNSYRLCQYGDVVLVGVNSRLGPIGLMAHPLLSAESPNGVSGNYMFLDLIAALNWVQRNIAEFGGNPKNVTIFGVSGGGAKVADLVASPLATGLFHRAICQSGAPFENHSPGTPLNDSEAIGERLFEVLGVDGEADPLAAARALPWEEIFDAEQVVTEESGQPLGPWDVTVDGWFIDDTPLNVFRAGEQNAVPIMCMAALGELVDPGPFTMAQVIPSYVDILTGASMVGVDGYACIFDQVPAGLREQGVPSFHGIGSKYIFGDWDNTFGSWSSFGDPGLTDVDEKVSKETIAMWTQFAKTGDPNVKKMVTWPVWEAATDQYLLIVEPLQVESGFSQIGQ